MEKVKSAIVGALAFISPALNTCKDAFLRFLDWVELNPAKAVALWAVSLLFAWWVG